MLSRLKDANGGRLSPQYYQASSSIRDRWMVSYMDVLTIILMFFLGVAAQSLHRPQASQAAAPAAPAIKVPVTSPKPLTESRQALLRAQKILEQYGISLRMESEGLLISLPQAVLFPSGEDRVNPEARPIIGHIAEVLRDIPNDVKLVGHADSVPIHNNRFTSNWALAMARSLRIQELFSAEYGIPEGRLSIASYGPYRPNSSNDTPDGRAQNRRVEIMILDEAGVGK